MAIHAPLRLVAVASMWFAACAAHAMPHDHAAMGHGASPSHSMLSNAAHAQKAAMNAMHHAMMIGYAYDPDSDFAAGMIPHHQGAVEMARIQLQYGSNSCLKWLAQFIITWQESEIALMKQWLNRRGYQEPIHRYGGERAAMEFKAQMQIMHHAMDISYLNDADRDFIAGMIPHHQGAIDMAKTQLKYGRDPELRQIAKDIIRSQNQEIRLMQHILARLEH